MGRLKNRKKEMEKYKDRNDELDRQGQRSLTGRNIAYSEKIT